MPTAAQFRKLALSMPEAEEKSHFGNPDFRVANKIFAGLSEKETQGTLKLTPEIQSTITCDGFTPAAGAWGRQGWTRVELARADIDVLRELMRDAWRIVAPKNLLEGAPKKAATASAKKTTTRAKKMRSRG